MRSILFITRHTPLPWEDGAGAYLHDLARYLAGQGFRVDVLWLAPHEHLQWQKVWRLPRAWASSLRLQLPGAIRLGRRFVFPAVVWQPFQARTKGHIRRALSAIGFNLPRRDAGALPRSAPSEKRGWMAPPSAAELNVVQKFVAQLRPDVVIASYAWMCPVFDLPALGGVLRACLTHDVMWKRAALSVTENAGTTGPEITRLDEEAWLRRASLIIAISESDAGEMRLLAPAARVMVAPKALDPCRPFPDSRNERILFVGSANAFNAEGLEWFLREVWPRIRREAPGATLDVCGTIDRAVALRPEGVVFHGTVSRLDSYYEQAALAIVPLLRATGLNIKLVEAAAFGRAIVATPNTLIGAPFLRDAVVAAESADDFASAVQRFLIDPAARTAAAARTLAAVQARLAPATCYGPLASLLSEPNEPNVPAVRRAGVA